MKLFANKLAKELNGVIEECEVAYARILVGKIGLVLRLKDSRVIFHAFINIPGLESSEKISICEGMETRMTVAYNRDIAKVANEVTKKLLAPAAPFVNKVALAVVEKLQTRNKLDLLAAELTTLYPSMHFSVSDSDITFHYCQNGKYVQGFYSCGSFSIQSISSMSFNEFKQLMEIVR